MSEITDTTEDVPCAYADAVDAYELGMLHNDVRRLEAERILLKNDLETKEREIVEAHANRAKKWDEICTKYKMTDADSVDTKPPFAIKRGG